MDYSSYINQAATKGPDMTKSNSGGGGSDYTPPPPGPVMLRFVGYIEVGERKETFSGQEKTKDKVKLIFECHGKNYPNNDRITITETLSTHDKSNFRKIFLSMRGGDSSVTHMAQLLGRGFRGRITHHNFTGRDGKKKIYARLRDDNGYNIFPPTVEDLDTGEIKMINVPEAVSKTRLFLWNFCDKAMWDSLYIDGQYSDGRTKNIFQEEIKQATNFRGSKIDMVLNGGGAFEKALAEVDLNPNVGERKSFRPSNPGFSNATQPQDQQEMDGDIFSDDWS